jgi:hypothetical protein
LLLLLLLMSEHVSLLLLLELLLLKLLRAVGEMHWMLMVLMRSVRVRLGLRMVHDVPATVVLVLVLVGGRPALALQLRRVQSRRIAVGAGRGVLRVSLLLLHVGLVVMVELLRLLPVLVRMLADHVLMLLLMLEGGHVLLMLVHGGHVVLMKVLVNVLLLYGVVVLVNVGVGRNGRVRSGRRRGRTGSLRR